jgi:hypothetical protein
MKKAKVVIIAGSCGEIDGALFESFRNCLLFALSEFSGTVIGGGTREGVAGLVGDIRGLPGMAFQLIGYRPLGNVSAWPSHHAYDDVVFTEAEDFGMQDVERYWQDLADQGIDEAKVRMIGFGGGEIAESEYVYALHRGATVALIRNSGGAAELLGESEVADRFLDMPLDPRTLRLFLDGDDAKPTLNDEIVEKIAQAIHSHYLEQAACEGNQARESRDWRDLPERLQNSNRDAAKDIFRKLRQCDLRVQFADPHDEVDMSFDEETIEALAAEEHARWTMELLRKGWRYGRTKSDETRQHPCLVPYAELPDADRQYDMMMARTIPEYLRIAGMQMKD